MDNIIDIIYNMFTRKLKDLEFGSILIDKDLCDMWELIHAYELLDSELLNSKEQKQIINYYEE